MEFLANLDLFSVAVTAVSIGILGFLVFYSNKNSITNKTFLLLSIVIIFWSVVNYISHQLTSPVFALWSIRLVLFFAIWFCFLLFQFAFVFPNETQKFSFKYKKVFLPLVSIISIFTLTPFVVKKIEAFSLDGTVSYFLPGPGIFAFATTVISLLISTAYIFLNRTFKAEKSQKRPFLLVLVGITLTLILLLVFVFFLPAFFSNSTFIPLGALFMFPFVAFTFYSIFRHKLLNVKVLSSGVLTIALALSTFIEIIFAETLPQILLRTSILLLVLIFGILLIKSVLKEVEQRQKIEQLAIDLEKANVRLKELDQLKSEFISIASHQLRSPLTAIKGYSSLVLDGTFGPVSDSVKEANSKILESSSLMAVSIQDFLDVSRIEQGKMKYNFEEFDLKKVVKMVADEQTVVAKQKGLTFITKINSEEEYKVNADLGKTKQVITNIVDNSIKYTPKGSLTLSLAKGEDGKFLIEITDTGVGISAETLPKLFDRFVRDKNANKVNVKGTGLGLYVAKKMMEEQKGRIWATSPGEGEGSTFHIEFTECKN